MSTYEAWRVDRFFARVNANGVCWEWLGAIQNNGYGKATLDDRATTAHRVSWRLLVGPIPDGMTLDHLCRNKVCVNPDHLEVVTSGENSRRGKRRHSCRHGHPRTPENLTANRGCKTCAAARDRAYKEANRGELAARQRAYRASKGAAA